jgi:hypothetical protein
MYRLPPNLVERVDVGSRPLFESNWQRSTIGLLEVTYLDGLNLVSWAGKLGRSGEEHWLYLRCHDEEFLDSSETLRVSPTLGRVPQIRELKSKIFGYGRPAKHAISAEPLCTVCRLCVHGLTSPFFPMLSIFLTKASGLQTVPCMASAACRAKGMLKTSILRLPRCSCVLMWYRPTFSLIAEERTSRKNGKLSLITMPKTGVP